MCSSIHPFPPAQKACSGKCLGTCPAEPGVWVVAACNGRVAMFSKQREVLSVIPQGEGNIFPSLEEFVRAIRSAAKRDAFNQLLIIGAPGDLAWLQVSLPPEASGRVVAEVPYPLLPEWFQPDSKLAELRGALTHVLH